MKMLEKNIPEGYGVRVHHQHTDGGKLDATVAVVYDRDSGETVGFGRALVNHKKDKSPSRKLGRAIAVGRAMWDAGFAPERESWQEKHGIKEFDYMEEVVYVYPYLNK